MAALETLALDTAVPQIRAPGVGDTYAFPREIRTVLGSASASAIGPTGGASGGGFWWGSGAGTVTYSFSTFNHFTAGNAIFKLRSDSVFGFANTSDSTAALDTAMERKAAKITGFNSGTAGVYTGTAFGNGLQTVAQLPVASTCTGFRAIVSDGTAPVFGATVTGGGAVVTPVYSDGSAWKVG